MKQLNLLILSLFFLSCITSSDEKKITTDLITSPLTANMKAEKVLTPKIEILETSYNFGEIQQGESVSHEFILKNSGDADLIITAAKGSCGCTVPEWPKNPIAKGEEASIKVTFNSAGKSGKQNKTVTLVSNAIPSTKVITINGNVIIPQKK
tara:strand:- start:98 stop:553 length:456 start_codon:yes stop_codon:yes gene_type:complete